MLVEVRDSGLRRRRPRSTIEYRSSKELETALDAVKSYPSFERLTNGGPRVVTLVAIVCLLWSRN